LQRFNHRPQMPALAKQIRVRKIPVRAVAVHRCDGSFRRPQRHATPVTIEKLGVEMRDPLPATQRGQIALQSRRVESQRQAGGFGG